MRKSSTTNARACTCSYCPNLLKVEVLWKRPFKVSRLQQLFNNVLGNLEVEPPWTLMPFNEREWRTGFKRKLPFEFEVIYTALGREQSGFYLECHACG